MSRIENNIPLRLCLKLPLTSLGELQNAPKARAMAISTKPNFNPITTGNVKAIPTIIAFEKSVLFKNSKNSLKFVEMVCVKLGKT